MTLVQDLSAEGLAVLGQFEPNSADNLPEGTRTLALVGPDGPAFWAHFKSSPEFRDGGPDPLDRWSERVLVGIAARHGAAPLFPFSGPPWHPFPSWALRCESIQASPVGLLVHHTLGLFVSFRGALALPQALAAEPEAAAPPCLSCAAKPCRSACPVGALNEDGYDVPACKAHLGSPAGKACLSGCLVRRACPVGATLRSEAQSEFHMKAFIS